MKIGITKLIGLDFETYGPTDLPTHGLERYVSDPDFRPLIGSTSWYDQGLTRHRQRFDFTPLRRSGTNPDVELRGLLKDRIIVPHNAGFERRVLQHLGIDLPASRFIDSAVVARAAGAAGKLEAAAPQLLDADKLASGWDLIKLFSIPSVERHNAGERAWDSTLPGQHPEKWELFQEYCDLDADLGLDIVKDYIHILSEAELAYMAVTMEMNQTGWPVDVDTVEEMQRRYLENVEAKVEQFRATHDAAELNLNSLKQLKEWCAERGIKASSFDEKNVAKLIKRITDKRLTMDPWSTTDTKYDDYGQVLDLLYTKQALGGSSLKKLRVILDTVGADGRLRDQYLHIGAPQSWRTTGRSVQMQNLKRLPEPMDMTELEDPEIHWENDLLAENIRQVFTSSDPQGALIVGDLASIESRGLAWLANAHWKLDAYRQGKDMYKVLAMSMFGAAYDLVTKDQRQAGKVGELACGYQAGGDAVRAFAEGMGVEFTEAEAAKLVYDWRRSNPEIVRLWATLDDTLLGGFKHRSATMTVGYDYTLQVQHTDTPASLKRQHPLAQSLRLVVTDDRGNTFLTRVFHGCYERGRGLCYYKPTERKTGDVWINHYTDPKTKQVKFFSIYGGKLAGILTQSFCRELFFKILRDVAKWVDDYEGVDLIGQFHDEIVLDWTSRSGLDVELVKADLHSLMTKQFGLKGFPMAAEIKHDYRYTK